jgi:hypothetical protein
MAYLCLSLAKGMVFIMLEIKPSTQMDQIKSYCLKCDRAPSEAFYLYTALDRGDILAAGLFEMLSDKVQVVYYEGDDNDPFLFDGVLRAGLNYAADQGVENGYIPEAFRQTHKDKFARLNYPPSPQLNIVNFFKKYKNCAT